MQTTPNVKDEKIDKIKDKKIKIRKSKAKVNQQKKKSTFVKPVINHPISIRYYNIFNALSSLRFNVNSNVIVGGTKEHAAILKQYVVTGLNTIFRLMEKDLIYGVFVMNYKHVNPQHIDSYECLFDLLSNSGKCHNVLVCVTETKQSEVRNVLQIDYNPRVVALLKTVLDKDEFADTIKEIQTS